MRRESPTFVGEFPLEASPGDLRVVRSRLEAGRQLYNAVLGASLARLRRMRQSPGWAAARALPRGSRRSAAFSALRVIIDEQDEVTSFV